MSHLATPRPRQTTETATKNVIEEIKLSLSAVGTTFETLNEKSAGLAACVPDVLPEIQSLRKQIREEHKKSQQEIQQFKREARDEVKERIAANLKEDLLEFIRKEITTQVESEVNVQLQQLFPISLKQQSVNNKAQLREAKTSLSNSAARKKNAQLRINDLDEPMMPVLKADGTRSTLFPADLRALLDYGVEDVRGLVRDLGLSEDAQNKLVNINTFLGHVGVMFELVVCR
ncbi:hypothetical protein MIND_00031900 [Mycena indigotica]|uniref:Uncharacterized protein n=1 Tax=Mycena indigotica TaxID=2126181 RepID=A0A8H6TG81_9AGAR|nr:uncharacterized protein MIND_00031900 [Mycena indigotica]KAF7315175.1 hypothetical protein MIND_00031900 [Mycena indigotica]